MKTYLSGIAAFLPIVLMLGIVFFPWPSLYDSDSASGLADPGSFTILVIGAVAFVWITIIGFLVYAAYAPSVPKEKRGLWIALILFGNASVLPFFWYWYVLQSGRHNYSSNTPEPADQQTGAGNPGKRPETTTDL